MHTRRDLLKIMGTTAAAGVLAACGTRLPIPPGPGTGTSSVDLVLGHFVPTNHEYHAQVLEPWARQVEQSSGGRIHITIHPGGALGPPPAQYKNVVAGAMDIGFGVQSYTPGRFPLTEGLELPFRWSSAEAGTAAFQSLYQSVPALRAEYADVKVLSLFTNGPAQLLTTRKQVKTLEDMRGLKVRSPGPSHNKTIESLGGAPLTMTVSEMYDALERGVAGGTISAPSVFTGFNLVDVVRYSTVARFTVACFFVAMNAEKWQSLSAEDQRVLDATAGETLAMQAARVADATDRSATAVAQARGVEFFELPEAELSRWMAAAQGVSDQWASELEARGLPGKQFLDEMARA
jgi:TRAP-type transport system periplasmic protein